jgi:hypothetical protein
MSNQPPLFRRALHDVERVVELVGGARVGQQLAILTRATHAAENKRGSSKVRPSAPVTNESS